VCSNAAQQSPAKYRLEQTLPGAQPFRLRQCGCIIPRCHHNDRSFRESGVALDFAKNGKTVHFGHQQIEQHEVNRFLAQDLEALLRGLNRHDLKFGLEKAGQDYAGVVVVVDNHDYWAKFSLSTDHGLRYPMMPANVRKAA